jgi:hypothetical protein
LAGTFYLVPDTARSIPEKVWHGGDICPGSGLQSAGGTPRILDAEQINHHL